MIFEHSFYDIFCDNFLYHSHIIFYFISLLFWFLCNYLLFLCKLWLSHKLSTKLIVEIRLLEKMYCSTRRAHMCIVLCAICRIKCSILVLDPFTKLRVI